MTKKYTRNIFGQPLFSFYREVIPKWASHCKWTLRCLQNIKLLNIKLCISNWEAPMHRKSLHIIWLDSQNGVQFYILPTNKSKQVTLFAPGPLHPGSNWHLETHQYPEDSSTSVAINQTDRSIETSLCFKMPYQDNAWKLSQVSQGMFLDGVETFLIFHEGGSDWRETDVHLTDWRTTETPRNSFNGCLLQPFFQWF